MSQVTPAPANLEGPVAAHDDATKAGDDVLGSDMEVIQHGAGKKVSNYT